MSKKHSVEFIELFFIKHGYLPLLENYENSKSKLIVSDINGYKFITTYTLCKSGKFPHKFSKNNPYTIHNINLWVELNNLNLVLLSNEYNGDNEKLKWKCLNDGNIWNSRFGNIRHNKGCPKCAINKKRLNINIIKEKLFKINPNIEILSDKYINNETKLKCKCLIDGYEWNSPWNKLQENRGCKKCFNRRQSENKMSTLDFVNKSKKVHDNTYQYDNTIYEAYNKKVLICCKRHGIFEQIPSVHTSGKGCPKCGIENHGGSYNLKNAEKNKLKFENIESTLYIISCYNNEEIFYKVGITRRSVSERFSSIADIPYKYKTIIEYKDNLYNCIILEKEIHKQNDVYRYIPRIKFGGYTECFSNLYFNEIYMKLYY